MMIAGRIVLVFAVVGSYSPHSERWADPSFAPASTSAASATKIAQMQTLGKRVLLTGGANFIGAELVRQPAEFEAEIVVVDNLAALASLKPGREFRRAAIPLRDFPLR
jgi:hypothetical protein